MSADPDAETVSEAIELTSEPSAKKLLADDAAKVVTKFNAKYAIVHHASKTQIVSWDHDELAAKNIQARYRNDEGLLRPNFSTFSEVRKMHLHEIRELPGNDGKPRLTNEFDFYVQSPNARRFARAEYQPGKRPTYKGPNGAVLNLWRGWAYELDKLRADEYDGCLPETPRLDEFLFEIIASGDEQLRDYVLNWIAFTYQHPADPIGVMLVMQGLQGVGKGTLAELWGAPWGANYFRASSTDDVFGRFAGHLLNKSAVFVDEGFWAGDPRAVGRLNALITEPAISIEDKGLKTVEMANTLKLMSASNADWVVPAGADNRRFQVFEPSPRWKGETDKWDALHQELRDGGRAAFFLRMLKRDIGGFNPQRDRVMTDAARRQARATHGTFVEFLAEFVSARSSLCFERGGMLYVPRKLLMESFRHFAEDRRVPSNFVYDPETAIEGEIKRIIGPGHESASRRITAPEEVRAQLEEIGGTLSGYDKQGRGYCYRWPTWRQLASDVLRAKFGIEIEPDAEDWCQ